MTGPEHYRQAEYLLGRVTPKPQPPLERSGQDVIMRVVDVPEPADRKEMIERAQVHATLALAAATALGSSAPWEAVAG